MKRRKETFVAVVLILAAVTLSSCHASGSRTEKWVMQTDNSQVLDLKFPVRSFVGKLHMVVFGAELKGSYVLKNATTTSEGSVTQDKGDYLLVSNDGAKQRFRMEGPSSLKDDSGAIWDRKEPSSTKLVLRKW